MFLKDFKQKVKDLKKENTITNIRGEDAKDYGYLLDGISTWLSKYGDVTISNLTNDGTNVSVVLSGTNRNSLKDYLLGYKNHNAKWDSNTNTFTMTLKPVSNTTNSEVTTNTTTVDPVAAAVPSVYGKIANDLLSISPIKAITNETKLFDTINRIKKLL